MITVERTASRGWITLTAALRTDPPHWGGSRGEYFADAPAVAAAKYPCAPDGPRVGA